MSRLAKNAGVICRQAKIAEAKQREKERQANCTLVGKSDETTQLMVSVEKGFGLQQLSYSILQTPGCRGLYRILVLEEEPTRSNNGRKYFVASAKG